MRIAGSDIIMASDRRYVQQGMAGTVTERARSLFADFVKGAEGEAKTGTAAEERTKAPSAEEVATGALTSEPMTVEEEFFALRNTLLKELWERIQKAGLFGSMRGLGGMPGASLGGMYGAGFGAGSGISFTAGGMSVRQVHYSESEDTAFMTKGKAKTEDGRELDFGINVIMSRAFMSYSEVTIPTMNSVLFDPLMLNVGANVAKISDQTFRFDLNMDGEEDDVAMPDRGTAFLALDRNEDGVINDGSELFGVQSGDGFADLAAYDEDGNGWIDENDAVYEKLRVWHKTADGTDEIMDLKAADVGAIYLGSRKTDFSIYGASMQLNAMVRATGFFLRESGGAGTVQHVDLSIGKNKEVLMDGEGADAATGRIWTGPDGALVVETAENTGVAGTQQTTSQKEQSADSNRRTDSNADKAKQEAARRRESMNRRAAEADRRKASLERYLARKELRKEQLEQLTEDKAAQKAQLEEAAEQKQMQLDAIEEEYLQNEISHTESIDAMVEEQLEVVA